MDLVGITRNKLVFAILSRANVRWRHTVFVTDDSAHAQCVDVYRRKDVYKRQDFHHDKMFTGDKISP